MRKSKKLSIKKDVFLIILVFLFLIYIYFALILNHSLFRNSIYLLLTFLIIFVLSILIPIKKENKITFKDLTKILFGFFPFLLVAISFLFITGEKLIENLNKITTINKFNLAGSIVLLYTLTIALFLFSYLSDNSSNKKLSAFFYRALIFCMLLTLCILISLFGSLISYFTYIP